MKLFPSDIASTGIELSLSPRVASIFWRRLEKPITMDVLVKQSIVALSLSSRFTKFNCKMWVKDRAEAGGFSRTRFYNT